MATVKLTTASNREPDWARVPPHVPTYPNPPAYFRQTPAEAFTAPVGKASYQKWWDKWHTEYPEWREEHYRSDPQSRVMRRKEFQPGASRCGYSANWQKPDWRQDYLRYGSPECETVRARGLNRIHWGTTEKNLYQFSNAMTSTQYKKPVTSIYGPLQREKVYGVDTQHNRHGFMPSSDYYF